MRVDPLFRAAVIEPATFRARWRTWYPGTVPRGWAMRDHLVQSQGAALDTVSAVHIEVTFDLARPGHSRHVPGLELAV